MSPAADLTSPASSACVTSWPSTMAAANPSWWRQAESRRPGGRAAAAPAPRSRRPPSRAGRSPRSPWRPGRRWPTRRRRRRAGGPGPARPGLARGLHPDPHPEPGEAPRVVVRSASSSPSAIPALPSSMSRVSGRVRILSRARRAARCAGRARGADGLLHALQGPARKGLAVVDVGRQVAHRPHQARAASTASWRGRPSRFSTRVATEARPPGAVVPGRPGGELERGVRGAVELGAVQRRGTSAISCGRASPVRHLARTNRSCR